MEIERKREEEMESDYCTERGGGRERGGEKSVRALIERKRGKQSEKDRKEKQENVVKSVYSEKCKQITT